MAFWEAKPWEADCPSVKRGGDLAFAPRTPSASLYDLLTGKETQIPWKQSEDQPDFQSPFRSPALPNC